MLNAARACSTRAELPSIDEEMFQRFMRDELGMYRFEQTVLTKAIQLLPLVLKTEEFKRRGERRQLAFMKNEGFKLAMRIAESDYLLSASQLAFWRNAFDRLSGELIVAEAEAKTKRRRRPRRPRKDRPAVTGVAREDASSDSVESAEADDEPDDFADVDEPEDDFSDIKLDDVDDSKRV